jgi:hypothetical protein
MDLLKRGTDILPVKDERFPTKCRKKSRARCPCYAISQLPQGVLLPDSEDGFRNLECGVKLPHSIM